MEARAAVDAQLLDAVERGDAEAIEQLVAEGASPNATRTTDEYGDDIPGGCPALTLAAGDDHAAAVSALARLGADLDARWNLSLIHI